MLPETARRPLRPRSTGALAEHGKTQLKLSKLVLAFALALTTLGCPPHRRAYFFNNTDGSVTLVLEAREINWPAGAVIEISTGGAIDWKDLHYVERDGGIHPTLLTTSADGKSRQYFIYAMHLPEGREYTDTSRGDHRAWYQLEPDSTLYHVTTNPDFPVDSIALRATAVAVPLR
jgi:hypothetical protein